MKKFLLVIVVFVLTIAFLVTAAAGTLLTVRTIGWNELADVSRFSGWSNQWNYNARDLVKFFDRRAGDAFTIDQTKSISSDELSRITEIHISALSETVALTTNSDSVEARISGSYISVSELIWEVEIQGTRLNIRTRYPKYGFRSQSLKMDIQIPADYTGQVFLNTLSGDCSLPDQVNYQWQSLVYDGLSADLSIAQASMSNLSLSTLSGNLTVHAISAPVTASSMSGNINLDFSSIRNVTIDTMSGDVSLSSSGDHSTHLIFRTLSGSFKPGDHTFVMIRQENRLTEGTLYQSADSQDSQINWQIETMSGDLIIR